jgi:hypothetical protein
VKREARNDRAVDFLGEAFGAIEEFGGLHLSLNVKLAVVFRIRA